MRRGLFIAVVASAMLLAAPAAQGAKFARTASISLGGTHGYRLDFEVSTPGRVFLISKRDRALAHAGLDRFASTTAKGPRDKFSVDVSKGLGSALYTDKSPDVAFGASRLSGSIGDRGRLDVRFHEKSHRRVALPPPCKGHLEIRKGTFRGRIAFHGERGYTRVDRRSAHGHETIPKHVRHCPFFLAHRSRSAAKVVSLTAVKHTHHGHFTTSFAALMSTKADAFGLVLALRAEKRADFSVSRLYLEFSGLPHPILTFRPDLSRARVHAPPHSPLRGTARFIQPDSWTGPLWIALPGRPHIRLTGHPYRARFGRGSLGRAAHF